MASNRDDLEDELRHNLRLRSKLGAEAAKGEAAISGKQGGGAGYRLGWVLYWTCLALVALWVGLDLFAHWDSGTIRPSLWYAIDWIRLIIPSLVLFSLGRAFRYVLSGE
jgi:hypothetical protein